MEISLKVCTKCNKEQAESEFYKNKRFGLTHWCKSCFKQSEDKRKQNNPSEFAQKSRDRTKKSYYTHHEENKQRLRVRGASEWGKQYQFNWRRTPKGKVKVARNNATRREFTKRDEKLTLDDIEKLIIQQRNQCNGCHDYFSDLKPYTIDHIYPVSLGGVLTKSNVQLLCRSCNSKKGNRVTKEMTI